MALVAWTTTNLKPERRYQRCSNIWHSHMFMFYVLTAIYVYNCFLNKGGISVQNCKAADSMQVPQIRPSTRPWPLGPPRGSVASVEQSRVPWSPASEALEKGPLAGQLVLAGGPTNGANVSGMRHGEVSGHIWTLVVHRFGPMSSIRVTSE